MQHYYTPVSKFSSPQGEYIPGEPYILDMSSPWVSAMLAKGKFVPVTVQGQSDEAASTLVKKADPAVVSETRMPNTDVPVSEPVAKPKSRSKAAPKKKAAPKNSELADPEAD